MPINLKSNTSLFTYIRYSPQKDRWYIPVDGTQKEVDIVGKPIAMDPENGQMGWLLIDTGTRDWRPFPNNGEIPKAPAPNYKRGFSMFVYAAKALGSPEIFEMCANTGAHNMFCEKLYNEAELAPEFGTGKIPIVKITGATPIKVGKGSSSDLHFEIVKWIDRPAAFTEAVARRDGNSNGASAPSDESGEDDFGLDATTTVPKIEPESKASSEPKKSAKKRTKAEPTSADILDDEIVF